MTGPALLARAAVYFRPQGGRWAAATAVLAAETALGVAAALLAKPLFDGALAEGGPRLAGLLAAQGGLFAAGTLLGLWRASLYARVGAEASHRVALDLYRSLQRQDLAFYADCRLADVQQRLYGDTQALEGAFSNALGGTFVAVLKVAAVGAWMFLENPALSAAAFAALAAAAALAALSARASSALLKEQLGRATALSGHILQTTGPAGLLLSSTYGLRARHEARFAELSSAFKKTGLARQLVPNAYSQAISLDVYLLGLALFFLGSRMVADGTATLGSLMTFAALSGYLTGPAVQLAGSAGFFGEAALRLRRVFEMTDRAPAAAPPLTARAAGRARGFLTAEGVAFAYRPDTPLLEGASLSLEPGKVCALVGPSGSGKTTFTHLLMRLVERHGGSITLDGTDLREWDLDDLRRQFSCAGQDALLFAGTLRENLTLGAAVGEKELADALELSGFAAKCRTLPLGLDTELGDGGLGLSGGERQRLALARALLKDAPLFILDEPTAFWDAESERAFPRVLDALRARGAAVLLITHRPALAEAADAVISVESGKLTPAP